MTLKTHQFFSIHTTPEEFENARKPGHFGFVVEENSEREITLLSLKLRYQDIFRPHENAKTSFSNSSGLKSVFEKLCFRDRLVWTVGLTEETKLRFQNFSGAVLTGSKAKKATRVNFSLASRTQWLPSLERRLELDSRNLKLLTSLYRDPCGVSDCFLGFELSRNYRPIRVATWIS